MKLAEQTVTLSYASKIKHRGRGRSKRKITAPTNRLRPALRRDTGPDGRGPVLTHAPPQADFASKAPASVIHDRIDVRAQFALLRLFKSQRTEDRRDAIALFHAVDSGEIQGIFGDDLGIAAQIAESRGTVRWELVPDDRDAMVLDDGLPDAPVLVFKAAADRPQGRLDQALLEAFRKHRTTPIFEPPEGVIPPGAFMKGQFRSDPKAEAEPNPHLKTGIVFPTIVAGLVGTKGWVFHVQNIMNRVDKVRIARGEKSKTCEARIPSQVLDTDYPYDPDAKLVPLNPNHPKVARFTGEKLSLRGISTSDAPLMAGPVGQDFEKGDLMTLSTAESFRMFIVWDPSTKESLPTRNDARPISLGFVDWAWTASATFRKILDFDSKSWKLVEGSSEGKNRGGGVFKPTPHGARVEVHQVGTGEQLFEDLRRSCQANGLKSGSGEEPPPESK